MNALPGPIVWGPQGLKERQALCWGPAMSGACLCWGPGMGIFLFLHFVLFYFIILKGPCPIFVFPWTPPGPPRFWHFEGPGGPDPPDPPRISSPARKVTKIKKYFSGTLHLIYGYFYA